MNEFEFKAYKSKVGPEILGACLVEMPKEEEKKEFIMYYEYKGVIFPMDNITVPGEFDSYKKKENQLNEGMESWNRYVKETLWGEIKNERDIETVQHEIYFILEDTLSCLKRIKYYKKDPKLVLEKLKEKKIGKIETLEAPIEQYKEMIKACGVEKSELKKYIEKMKFEIV